MSKTLGIFDSGVGGLTVLKAILERNAYDRVVYYGDTKNVPYGTKTKEKIIELSLADLKFLEEKACDEVVVACNTICANALQALRENADIPVHSILEATIHKATETSRNGEIGLIATAATVNSDIYSILLKEINPHMHLTSVPCPKFVLLAERGIIDPADPELKEACEEYLRPLKERGIDTLILGCTHFPILRNAIGEFMGDKIHLVDNGSSYALTVAEGKVKEPLLEFYTSGEDKAGFEDLKRIVLG